VTTSPKFKDNPSKLGSHAKTNPVDAVALPSAVRMDPAHAKALHRE